MKKLLLLTLFALCAFGVYAQSGIKGQVVSRNGRTAVEQVKVTLDATGQSVTTDVNGNFIFPQLEKGDYRLLFSAPDFEPLEVMVHVDANMRDLHTVILVPTFRNEIIDDSIFAEFDNDRISFWLLESQFFVKSSGGPVNEKGNTLRRLKGTGVHHIMRISAGEIRNQKSDAGGT